MLDPWSVALEGKLTEPTEALPLTSLGGPESPRGQHTGQPLKMSGSAWSLLFLLLTLLIPHWAPWGMGKPGAHHSGKAEEEPR